MTNEPDWKQIAEPAVAWIVRLSDNLHGNDFTQEIIQALKVAYALGKSHAPDWLPVEGAPKVPNKPLLFASFPFNEFSVGTWDSDGWDMQCAPPMAPFTHYQGIAPEDAGQ